MKDLLGTDNWKCWMSKMYSKDAHPLVVVYWFWFLHRYLLFIYVVLLKDTKQTCRKYTWFIIYFENIKYNDPNFFGLKGNHLTDVISWHVYGLNE